MEGAPLVRIPRFLDFLQEALSLAQHPEIARVDTFDDPDTALKPCGIAITTIDGRVYRLKAIRTSGPGGEKADTPEIIPYPDYEFPEGMKWESARSVDR